MNQTTSAGIGPGNHEELSVAHFGLVGGFFITMLLGVIIFASLPRAVGDKMVVFVAPWSQPTEVIEVIAEAGGAYVGNGNRSWIAVGISQEPGFVARLYKSGAWFVGSGEAFSACIPANENGFNGLN